MVLSAASDAQVAAVTDGILARQADLATLMADGYGNYVLQTLLRRIDDAERRAAALETVRAATTNVGHAILARIVATQSPRS